jgi:hypothetical protein
MIDILEFESLGLGKEEIDHWDLHGVRILFSTPRAVICIAYPCETEAGKNNESSPPNVVDRGWRYLHNDD